MAEYSKEKIGFQLARALSHPFVSICYTKFPRHDSMDSKRHAMPEARFFICLSGSIHLRFHQNNGPEKDVFLQPGESVFGAPGNVIREMWDSPQEMMAGIFYDNMTRIIYIEHDGIAPPPYPVPNPTLYYHIPRPINPSGRQIIKALEHIARSALPQTCLPGGGLLFQALLQNINYDLHNHSQETDSPKNFLWNEIYAYISDKYASPELSRASISKRFHIHQAYLSRLFLEKLGISFKEYICERRFSMAKELLADPSMHIDEISQVCGFQYPSYFIRAFKQRFNMTPGEYREKLS